MAGAGIIRKQEGKPLEPTVALVDELYRETIRQARKQSPSEKLLDGPRLFDFACEWMSAGVRAQHPDAGEDRVLEILKGRLALAEKLECADDERGRDEGGHRSP
jgi:hypothetical protein